MPFSVTGSFIECFGSIEACQVFCSFGECFYVDSCNGHFDTNYYCSAASPYKAIFLSLAILFIIFICCCGGFSLYVWSTARRRSHREPTYVLRQPSPRGLQYYHPRPASRSTKY
uniref:Uncharacterized protein n=1 Tax=Steinernema glaseri TaxID=37863 RepID=A0A1I7ZGF8_9BILA